jgi:two-component system response regulator CpxR
VIALVRGMVVHRKTNMERERDLSRAVLIVEDNYPLRITLAAVLEEEDYPVVTASNGAIAIQLLQGTTQPALIILDLMLPIVSGWEVLSYLQGNPRCAHIPVMVLSAIAEDPTRQPNPPVATIMPKPVDLDTLLMLVDRFYPRVSGQAA